MPRATAETPAQMPSALVRSSAEKAAETIASDRPSRGGRAEALHEAAADQHLLAARGGADDRSRGKQRHAGEEDRAPAEDVPHAARSHDGGGQHEQIAVDDPLQAGGGRADVVDDRREREVDHRGVEHEHEQAHAGAGERPPPAVCLGQSGEGADSCSGRGQPNMIGPWWVGKRY